MCQPFVQRRRYFFRNLIASLKQILCQSVKFLYQITYVFFFGGGVRAFALVLTYILLFPTTAGFFVCFVFFSCICTVFVLCFCVCGHAVAQSVEALRYKPEGRGFDSR